MRRGIGSRPFPAVPFHVALVHVVQEWTAQDATYASTDKLRGRVPKWAPSTVYAKGASVIAPSGSTVHAFAAFTSEATYGPVNWSTNKGFVTMAGTNPSNVPS